MKRILLALQFLSIIPVRVNGEITEKDISGVSAYFPLAGALQGFVLLITGLLFARIFPIDLTAGFLVAVMIVYNGAFHLDGLADTFDALAVKASGDRLNDRVKRLEVMKDSATGAIGVVAVIMVILLKFLLLKNLLSFSVPLTAFLILFLMPVFSRWIMVPAMYHGSSARKEGLGKTFIEGASTGSLFASTAIVTSFFGLIFLAHLAGIYGLKSGLIFCLLPAGYLFAAAAAGICLRIFGGLTGDTLGALSELSEIYYLTGAYIWLQHFI
jgi:adenosylcobinamide-GDP ribazoletransferase